ncbi:MAG: hypothetical protein ACRD6X_14060 [Pyrinomonadaceae bacterium]
MDFYRQTIKNAPSMIAVPDEMRNRDVEVIILPLDQNGKAEVDVIERDAMGYPLGFFEETAGSIPDFPEREPQPPHDIREPIE